MPINFARRDPNPGFDKKLAVYALAGGAMLGLPDAALAGIIHDPPGSVNIFVPNGGGKVTHDIDVDGDSIVDLVLIAKSTLGDSQGSYYNSVTADAMNGGIRVDAKSSYYARPYESQPTGALGLPLKYRADLITSYYNGSTLFGPDGLWPNDSTQFRFLGFTFLHNGVTTNGWVKVATELGSAGFSVDSFGFDSGAVPEPASMALFAAGAAGIAAWRRRKAQ